MHTECVGACNMCVVCVESQLKCMIYGYMSIMDDFRHENFSQACHFS